MDKYQKLDRLEGALIGGRIDRRAFIVGALATGLMASSAVHDDARVNLPRVAY